MKIKKVYAISVVAMAVCMVATDWSHGQSKPEKNNHTKTTDSIAGSDSIPAEGEILLNKEGYKLSEVLFIPWGNGENEITMSSEGEAKAGPTNFLVDNVGNIYINDPGKYHGRGTGRMIKYSPHKKTMHYLQGIEYIHGVINNGEIVDGRGRVYNAEGGYLYKFRLPPTSSSIKKIIQRKDQIYVWTGEGYNALVISNEKDKGGYNLASFKEDKKTKYYEQTKGYPSRFFDRNYLVPGSTDVVRIVHLDKHGKEERKTGVVIEKAKGLSRYQAGDNPQIIGDDNQGNIYSMRGFSLASPYYPKKGFPTIQKCNEKGEVLLVVRRFTNSPGLAFAPVLIELDENGNIYQLYSMKDGVRIVKWGK